MESRRLKTHLLGHELSSPVIVASSFLTRNIQLLRLAEEHGAGGISIKQVSMSPIHSFMADLTLLPDRMGMIAAGDVRPQGEEMLRVLREFKKETKIMVIGNLGTPAGDPPAKWQEAARIVEEAGADNIEVKMAQSVDATVRIIRAIKAAVSIPVIIKLKALALDPTLLAQACEDAGADAITISNALPAAPPIDIWNGGRSPSNFMENLTWNTVIGHTIFPIACYSVGQVSKTVKIPVIGSGGITTWKDVVKMVMWGASAVQICSAIALHGFELLDGINRGLDYFLEKNNYSSIQDFRGLSLKQVLPETEVKLKDIRLSVREDLCDLCMRCLHIGQCLAISLRDNTISIDNEECIRCGLCMQVCPPKAIEVQSVG